MSDDIRQNLPTLVVVFGIGLITCAFAISMVLGNASSFNVSAFSLIVFIIPSIVMVLAPFAVTLVSQRVGRKLYVLMLIICLIFGVAMMILASMWLSDPEIAAKLLANSPAGMTIVTPVNSPLIVMRDIAGAVVCPTIGAILGTWLGSRLHPVSSTTGRKRK